MLKGDGDLSGGLPYPAFKQPEPGIIFVLVAFAF